MAYETVPNKCKPLKRTFNLSLLLQDKKVKTVCVMPCYDKKLEAVRPNFKFGGPQEEEKEPIKEIDTVLATHELFDLFELKGIQFDKVTAY